MACPADDSQTGNVRDAFEARQEKTAKVEFEKSRESTRQIDLAPGGRARTKHRSIRTRANEKVENAPSTQTQKINRARDFPPYYSTRAELPHVALAFMPALRARVPGHILWCARRNRRQTPNSGIQLISYTNSCSSCVRSWSFQMTRLSVSQCALIPRGAAGTGSAIECSCVVGMHPQRAIRFPTSPDFRFI